MCLIAQPLLVIFVHQQQRDAKAPRHHENGGVEEKLHAF
jgi:hypothetical protein